MFEGEFALLCPSFDVESVVLLFGRHCQTVVFTTTECCGKTHGLKSKNSSERSIRIIRVFGPAGGRISESPLYVHTCIKKLTSYDIIENYGMDR